MADDVELQLFRGRVNCAAILEGMVGGWKLDVRESTRRALKYRRAKGEILIITHDGRGWWDPLSQAKGDIFDLVQHLDRGLNFGQVRQVLRRFVSVCDDVPLVLRIERGGGFGHGEPGPHGARQVGIRRLPLGGLRVAEDGRSQLGQCGVRVSLQQVGQVLEIDVAALCADIERNLTVHDPEQLRNSAVLRESIADEADAILERMQGAFA